MSFHGVVSRKHQVHQLDSLLSLPDQRCVPSVFIYGPSSCGKSTTLNHVLHKNKLRHIVVNCIELYTTSTLLNCILEGFGQSEAKCDNMNDFIREIRKILPSEVSCIVLDRAECLRCKDPSILPVLLHLQALTSCNVCVVLVSELPWDKFEASCSHSYPVFFPNYTREESLAVLCELAPGGVDPVFYRDYLTTLLSVFWPACRKMWELQYLAEANFPAYVRPVTDGQLEKEERHRLWKNIEAHFQQSLQELYQRKFNCDGEFSKKSIVDLPLYSKFLLISSYIASYNPAATDRRFFLKHAGRLKRSIRSRVHDERRHAHLKGPRPFPLDRMMAIFYSIIAGRAPPSASLFTQITTLVSLHLLTRVGLTDHIDSPRYKCTSSFTFVCDIARTVNFDVVGYLYDFI